MPSQQAKAELRATIPVFLETIGVLSLQLEQAGSVLQPLVSKIYMELNKAEESSVHGLMIPLP